MRGAHSPQTPHSRRGVAFGVRVALLAAGAAVIAAKRKKPGSRSKAPGSSGSYVDTSLCSDTCALANDGVCQEGRRGLTRGGGAGSADGPFRVECDLGTDCSDCGPWHYTGPEEALAWTPVADIQKKQFQLNVRRTATPVPFFMPYTDPGADTDVSKQLADSALIEPGLTWVWHRLLSRGCGAGVNGERALVLDVGANFGYYSLMSAAMGCRVIAWEPVPHFAAFFQYGLLRNNLTGAVELRGAVVGQEHGAELTMVVPSTGIWGTAGVGGKNLDPSQRAAATERVVKRAERVDRVVPPQEVLLMKVDVEGFEPAVLSSAKDLLLHGDVANIIMEYSPGVAEANEEWDVAETNPGRLLGLTRAGYSVLHMDEPFRVRTGFEWGGALPAMPLVHAAALQHDVEDAKRLQAGRLGCPLPAEVAAAGGMWDCPGPFQVERLHPRGFRPTFGYNTNVWAFKGAGGPGVKGPPASLFPPDFDLRDYFSTTNKTYPHYPGHEMRRCQDEPPAHQVKFRCRCTDAEVCGALEAAVEAAARRNQMPPVPLDTNIDPAAYEIKQW